LGLQKCIIEKPEDTCLRNLYRQKEQLKKPFSQKSCFLIVVHISAAGCLCKLKSSGRPLTADDVERGIYGPTKESDGTWRIKSNEELNRLIGNQNIINYITAQRLACFGHIHRMPENSMVKRVYEWSPALTRSQGRPKNRWEDDVKSDIMKIKIANWRDYIKNRSKWKEFVEKAKTSSKL
jgi:hypothetical protein